MRIIAILTALFLLLSISGSDVFAQKNKDDNPETVNAPFSDKDGSGESDDDGTTNNESWPPDPGTGDDGEPIGPVDGGLSILLGAAAAYFGLRFYRNRKEK